LAISSGINWDMIFSEWTSTSRPHGGALVAKSSSILLKMVEVIPDVIYVPYLIIAAIPHHVMQNPNGFHVINHMSVLA